MEIKYQDMTQLVNKSLEMNNIDELIITGLKYFQLEESFLEVSNMKDIVYLFSSIVKKEYEVELKIEARILFGILYACIPNDIIPDFLGPFGYVDDYSIIKLVSNLVGEEIEIYQQTEAYTINSELYFDLEYMFPDKQFKAYLNSPEFTELKSKFNNFFPTTGSIFVEETTYVQHSYQDEYHAKGYQNETINFFPAHLDEVVYIFNNLLYQSEGKCIISEKMILDRIILPSNSTREIVKKVLDNADHYYNTTFFSNFEKTIIPKFGSVEYSFKYDIISLKEVYFEIEKPKLDCYADNKVNVYNVIYNASLHSVNWESVYEAIELIKRAKSQSKFEVNYLIKLNDLDNTYHINYNSILKKVRVSTCNTRTVFFEKDLEELIQNKI